MGRSKRFIAMVVAGIMLLIGTIVFCAVTCESNSNITKVSVKIGEKEYTSRNQKIFLIAGLDTEDSIESTNYWKNSYQSDFICLLSFDYLTKKYSILHLNRDSIVRVYELGFNNQEIGTREQQLALAYTYGDGQERSCVNLRKTVSTMLFGTEIDFYVTFNMAFLKKMNDFVSDNNGIPVTMDKDYTEINPSYTNGSTVSFLGEQALEFVRARSGVEGSSNINRMHRQQVYIKALFNYLEGIENHGNLVSEAYDVFIKDNNSKDVLTNAGLSTFKNLVHDIKEYNFDNVYSIDGEVWEDPNNPTTPVEFRLDKNSLIDVATSLYFSEEK